MGRGVNVIPYEKRDGIPDEKPDAVRKMFNSIALRYDLMNDIMTGGLHRRWKRLAVKESLGKNKGMALDLACGTGDLGLIFARSGAEKVICIDFSERMLDVARMKAKRKAVTKRLSFSRTDALNLPFPDATFDSVATGFSLRNVDGIAEMFKEVQRVLKPGGRFAVLELAHMKSSLTGKIFNFYFKKIIPLLGGIITGDRAAYDYLPESISNVPGVDELELLLANTGFSNVKFRLLGWGSVVIISGEK
ncbi:MAG: bifunctional demethylmenaquinone methyltransferase/2-methoxy-6-polyprenyl-1,4-benzoquinol methylase UbiE [Candidatus Marinimicrobia bacterium]|nr:bifunctional demethylmenaquinone methyltransferase/2-methoxy-6-polyprenyl-1,4-benzoquinol methylase UbiE [Candidatus Neomarinimicrobiota bacterium]